MGYFGPCMLRIVFSLFRLYEVAVHADSHWTAPILPILMLEIPLAGDSLSDSLSRIFVPASQLNVHRTQLSF